MILDNLHIESFRGMTGVHLENLAPVSVAVGENNVGKSSLLEATALLLRPFDPTLWVQVARQRDFDLSLVDGIWSLFPSSLPLIVDDGPKQTKPLKISGTLGGRERAISASGLASSDWESNTPGALTLRVESFASEDKSGRLSHTMEFRRGDPAQFGENIQFYRCYTINPATHRSMRTMIALLSRSIDMGEKAITLELLKTFDPEITGLDVSLIGGREGIRIDHMRRGVVDLSSFGDGMRRSAALALALALSRDGLLLIDELEAGIHPKIMPVVLSRLFSAAQVANVQIIATTHSLEAIDALIEALQGTSAQAAAYYLSNNQPARRYQQDELRDLREMGFDIR